MDIRVKLVNKNAQLPQRGTDMATCYDLRSMLNWRIPPGGVALLPTGLIFYFPQGYAGEVWPRSGISLKRRLEAIPGQIDNDYQGETMVALKNTGTVEQIIHVGDRVAQMKIIQLVPSCIREVQGEVLKTARGSKGFGSTGQ